MHDRYRSRSRDGSGFRRHDHQNTNDDADADADARGRDRDYYRSRKAAQSPARGLNYDDDDEEEEGEERPRGQRQHRDHLDDRDYSRSYGPSDHHDRDRDWDRDRDQDRDWDRDRNHGRGRRRNDDDHSSDSGTVILENLPKKITERDIYDGLDYVARDRHMSDDQVMRARLLFDDRDRLVARVDFFRRSDAEYFYDKYRPYIVFPYARSGGGDPALIRVDIDLDTGRNDSRDRQDNADWDCVNCGSINYAHRASCHRCRVERPEDDGHGTSGSGRPVLTGETDEDPQQLASQYIVIRDLEGSVTEEVLSKGIMKLFLDTKPEPVKATTNKLKSTAPTNSTAGLGAKPGTLRRIFLMRDRRTNESWRYGFAEFATIDDARAAVAKFRASARFTIASKPVCVAFIHTGVFVPVQDALAMGDDLEKFSFVPVYNQAIRLRYWYDHAYPSALVVNAAPIAGPESPTKEGAGEEARTAKAGSNPNRLPASFKKIKKEKEAAIAAAAAATASTKGIVMAPQIQMWAKKSAELHGSRAAVEGMGEIPMEDHDALGNAAAIPMGEGQEAAFRQDSLIDKPCNPRPTDQYSSYADWDRLACLLCDWEPPPQDLLAQKGYGHYRREDILIDHEMRHHKPDRDMSARQRAADRLAAAGKEPRTVIRRVPRLLSAAPPAFLSYADPDARHCHLCRRRFKHVTTVWRHECESELHRRLLDDPASRQRALAELKAKGKDASSSLAAAAAAIVMVPDLKARKQWWEDLQELKREAARRQQQQQQSQYRDRAQERRAAFNQPSKPSAAAATGEKRKDRHERDQTGEEGGGGGGGQQKQQPAAKKPAVAGPSKGMGMLAKMGWTAGAGLGAEGTGRTEAIATDAYAPGVGLGAEGGKLGDAVEEASRKTRGHFSDFVEKTRDKARERFEKM